MATRKQTPAEGFARGKSPGVKFAALADIQEAVADMDPRFITCRRSHRWEGESAKRNPEVHTFVIRERCDRCEMTKTSELDERTGDIIGSPHYNAPDGYYMPKGVGRIGPDGRGTLRLAYVQGLLDIETGGRKGKRRTA